MHHDHVAGCPWQPLVHRNNKAQPWKQRRIWDLFRHFLQYDIPCITVSYTVYRIRTGTNWRHCTKVWTAPLVGAHNQTSWCPSQDLHHSSSHVCSLTHKLATSNTLQAYQLHIILSSLFVCLATQRCRKCFLKDWWQGSCQDGRGSNVRPTSPTHSSMKSGSNQKTISENQETTRSIFKAGKSGITADALPLGSPRP